MFNIETKKVLLWDSLKNSMSVKTEVFVQIKGNQGTVFFEEGPLFCETGQEIFQAVEQLKSTLLKKYCSLETF